MLKFIAGMVVGSLIMFFVLSVAFAVREGDNIAKK